MLYAHAQTHLPQSPYSLPLHPHPCPHPTPHTRTRSSALVRPPARPLTRPPAHPPARSPARRLTRSRTCPPAPCGGLHQSGDTSLEAIQRDIHPSLLRRMVRTGSIVSACVWNKPQVNPNSSSNPPSPSHSPLRCERSKTRRVWWCCRQPGGWWTSIKRRSSITYGLKGSKSSRARALYQ